MSRSDAVPAGLGFALVAVLGFDNGGFSAPSWGWSVVLLLAVAVALARGARLPPSLAIAFLAALTALLAWSAISTAWSLDPTASLLDAQRLLLYVSAAAALLLYVEPAGRRPLLAGALAAITLVCAAGLADVLVGDDPVGAPSADPGSEDRLGEPLGYANAVGLLAAMGALLAVGFALTPMPTKQRVLAAGVVPVPIATLYFTYSRGAWVALGLGLAAAVALPRLRFTARSTAALAAALVAGALLAVLVVGDSFTEPATPASQGGSRLLTLQGSSRVDYWRTALDDVADHPLLGSGAGSYGRYWARHRPVPQPASDAHSLYLETLAELGPLALAALVAALALPAAAAVAARRDPLTPVAFGPYVAYLAHAAQDWDWELPAVTCAAIVCAASLLLARAGPVRRAPRATAAAAVVLALAAAGAYAGNRELAVAEEGSESAARRAARLQPWSGEPWRLRGEAQLERGDLEAARASFAEGIERDDGAWELWLDLALASEGDQRRRALDRAAELNPRSPELAELRAAGFDR